MRFAGLLAVLATLLGESAAICVLDNKKGWNVQCGIRDSYLLRLKDVGGIKANFDFGFGLGDEEGFAESIQNTDGGHYARSDDVAAESYEKEYIPPRQQALRRVSNEEGLPYYRYSESGEALPPFRKRPAAVSTSRSSSGDVILEPEHRSSAPQRFIPVAAPSFGLLPPPIQRRQTFAVFNENNPAVPVQNPQAQPIPQASGQGNFHTQQVLLRPGTQQKIVFTHAPAPPTPSPADRPTVGPEMADLLKVAANTPADTDHVPSFAAKMFIVREAPEEFNPPGYKVPNVFPKINKRVEVPRTKFFCEEQKYLPGLYADVQLGCKVFHMCMPAAMGNTLTSFLCPNMTLFDQSIMQCNYWYHVNCQNSPNHYDANLAMALGYRKMNAAQLPLTAVRDFDNVALLNAFPQAVNAQANPSVTENLAVKRIGEVESEIAEERIDEVEREIPRGPRMMRPPY